MVLESELNENLAACRLQALRDALAVRPATTIAIGGFEDGVRHKESAIQGLIEGEAHYTTLVSPIFEYAKISVLAYANGFTLWHYKCGADDHITEFFFEAAADLLTVGDIIIFSGASSGAGIVSVVAARPPRIVSMVW